MSLSRIFKWLCPLALVVIAYAATRAGTPEDTVKAFVEAWNGKDLAKAAGLVVGGKPSADFGPLKTQGASDWPMITIDSMTSELNADKATVTAKFSVASSGSSKKEDFTEAINLTKVNDAWLIVPAELQDPANEKKVIGILSGLLSHTEIFAQAKKAAQKTSCLSNVKQLALGLLILAADNDDVIKIDLSRAKKAVFPYTKNDKLWYCPGGPQDKVAYTINPKVVNISMTAIQQPAETVLLYEGSKGQLDFRHEGKAAVAFTDGHAKMIDAEAAKKLRWKP